LESDGFYYVLGRYVTWKQNAVDCCRSKCSRTTCSLCWDSLGKARLVASAELLSADDLFLWSRTFCVKDLAAACLQYIDKHCDELFQMPTSTSLEPAAATNEASLFSFSESLAELDPVDLADILQRLVLVSQCIPPQKCLFVSIYHTARDSLVVKNEWVVFCALLHWFHLQVASSGWIGC